MGEVTLRLQIDRETGKRNVIVAYRSDADALPQEHEQEHRALVDKLIQGGALKASQLGKVLVQRETAGASALPEPVLEGSALAASAKS